MNFNRRDYITLAKMFKNNYCRDNSDGDKRCARIANDFATLLEHTHGNFNREKFLDMCGVPYAESTVDERVQDNAFTDGDSEYRISSAV